MIQFKCRALIHSYCLQMPRNNTPLLDITAKYWILLQVFLLLLTLRSFFCYQIFISPRPPPTPNCYNQDRFSCLPILMAAGGLSPKCYEGHSKEWHQHSPGTRGGKPHLCHLLSETQGCHSILEGLCFLLWYTKHPDIEELNKYEYILNYKAHEHKVLLTLLNLPKHNRIL